MLVAGAACCLERATTVQADDGAPAAAEVKRDEAGYRISRIRPGMTEKEVDQLLSPTGSKGYFSGPDINIKPYTPVPYWDWKVTVCFKDGRVVKVARFQK
jgi:hypothetical protein